MLNVCGWCQPNAGTHQLLPEDPPPAEDPIIPQDKVTPDPEVETADRQLKSSQDERRSASEDDSKPLLQQSKVYQRTLSTAQTDAAQNAQSFFSYYLRKSSDKRFPLRLKQKPSRNRHGPCHAPLQT